MEEELSLDQELKSLLTTNYSKEEIAYFQAETKEAGEYVFASPPSYSAIVTETCTNG